MTRLSILHDADGVVVVDKPPGLEATGRTPDDPGGVQHHLAVQLRRPVWAVHQLDHWRQHRLEAVAKDGVGVAAADLHDLKRAARADRDLVDKTLDLGEQRTSLGRIAELVDVLHVGSTGRRCSGTAWLAAGLP